MTELIQAAKAGSVLDVQKILKENNVDVNYQDIDYSYTALYWAAANGHVDVCGYLIRKRANINLQSKWGGSPLYVASYNGQNGTVHMLLSHGANVNLTDNHMRTPLHAAAYKGHLTVCEKLLDGGASVEAINADGKTPIVEAQGEGHQRIVNLFHRHVLGNRRGISERRCQTGEFIASQKAKAPEIKTGPLPLLFTAKPSSASNSTQMGNQYTGFPESHPQEKRYPCKSSQTNCSGCQHCTSGRQPDHALKPSSAQGPVGGVAMLNMAASSSSLSKNKLMEMVETLQLQVAMKNEEIENLKFRQSQQEIIYSHNIGKLSKELEEEKERRKKVQGHLLFLGNQLRYGQKDGDHELFDSK